MASDPSPEESLLIRCSSCATRFEVDEGMRGRMVECGECDHRFEINDSVIQRGKQFYPGESHDPFLAKLAKASAPLPHVGDKNVPDSFASQTKPVYIEPVSPLRVLVGAAAIFGVIVTALFLVLGANRGGALDGVSLDKRLLVAGFVSLMATGMLMYANARSRWWMLLLGLLISGGLVSLPFLFGAATLPSTGFGDGEPSAASELGQKDEIKAMSPEELKEWIGIEPLEDERTKQIEAGRKDLALGLWLLNLESHHLQLVKEYIIRATGASPETHLYHREGDNYLVVVTGSDVDLPQLAKISSRLGSVDAIHASLGIVQVEVSNQQFEPQSMEALLSKEKSDFYLANAIELKSIDAKRAADAVRRLTDAEPELLQRDISERMIDLLEGDWFEKKGEVCRGLLVWAQPDGKAGQIALQQAVKLHADGKEVPQEMVALCLQQGVTEVLPLLHQLWMMNPVQWEPWYREGGAAAEKILLRKYADTKGVLLQSACRILGHVGGNDSLPVLRATVAETSEVETRITANSSIQLIEKRLSTQE